MGRGSSKAGGGSSGGKSGGNGGHDSFINEMVDAMTRKYSIDETPFSNSDLQSAVEAYAMTHKGVNEDAMLDAIRDKVETATLDKYSSKYFKATRASDIKPGDKITDEIINETTGKEAHKMWTFRPEGYDTYQAYPNDVTVKSVKTSGKTTKVTATFDKALIKSYPQKSDFGKDLITVTKTFKNSDILKKRRNGGK